MPLFRVKKQVFEWIINKQKTIELRKGKAKKGDKFRYACACMHSYLILDVGFKAF